MGCTLTTKVEAPTFSQSSGTYDYSLTLTLSCRKGADIHYTTDGTAPTITSPTYSGPFAIPGGGAIIKAIATYRDWIPSEITVREYGTRLISPAITPSSGTYSEAQTVSIAGEASNYVIRYTTDGRDPDDSSPVFSGSFTVNSNTTIKAIAQNPGYLYFEIVSADYTFKTAAPTISPDESETQTVGQKVTLTPGTPEATIYYTTNGDTPTTSSTKYNDPFEIPADSTTINMSLSLEQREQEPPTTLLMEPSRTRESCGKLSHHCRPHDDAESNSRSARLPAL